MDTRALEDNEYVRVADVGEQLNIRLTEVRQTILPLVKATGDRKTRSANSDGHPEGKPSWEELV